MWYAALMLLLSTAFAATVAVLPLDQGAGGQAYEGLGTALAGMITSDLAGAPGLTLVERARLDALLGEIELGAGAYVDPATAQKLGKGLGAEYVVLGSYSVVGEQFVLDARLVNVEAGTVARAASAAGGIAGFVEVEKTLVGGLLDGLQVTLAEDARKALLARAPTRDFDAFAAWGEGQAAEQAGRLDEARSAYAEALSADPAFAQASTALGALRSALDASADQRVRSGRAARAALLDRVIAAHPPPTDAKDRKQRAGFALRLLALQELGRDCQRFDEMEAYLDLVGWKLSLEKGDYPRLVDEALALAVADGLTPAERDDPQAYADLQFRVQTEAAMRFGSVGSWFYGFPTMLLTVKSSSDLTGSLARCLTPPEQVAELGRLAETARARGAGAETVSGYPVPLAERFEWSALAVRARSTGLDDTASARILALVSAYPDTPFPGGGGGTARAWVESQAREILAAALTVERARAATLGWKDAELRGALEALAGEDPARVATADPDCAPVLPRVRALAMALVDRPLYAGLAAQVVPVADLGCLVGRPARFPTPADALGWVQTAPTRARREHAATCAPAFEELPRRLNPPGAPAAVDGARAYELLAWYYGALVAPLCVDDR